MFARLQRSHVAYAVALIVVALLGLNYLRQHKTQPAAPSAEPTIQVAKPSDERVAVHVAGAVRHPGVYRLRGDARVTDAVQSAGGPAAEADLSALNLAAKVEDGRQVLVPSKNPAGRGGTGTNAASTGTNGKTTINLNTATAEQLQQLDGVGPSTAKKILSYRQEHNGFTSVDELGEVAGIGEKRLAALRDQVTV